MARWSSRWKLRGDRRPEPQPPPPPQVTCYHKGSRGTDRTLVFRVQFHTCTIHGPRLAFPKDQLDEAWTGASEARGLGAGAQVKAGGGGRAGAWLLTNHSPQMRGSPSKPRWSSSSPPAQRRSKVKAGAGGGAQVAEGRLSLLFTPSTPGASAGSTPRNEASVSVDYNTAEPAVRWDSYENFNLHHEDSVDGVWGAPRAGQGWGLWGHTPSSQAQPPPQRPPPPNCPELDGASSAGPSLTHTHLLSLSPSLSPSCLLALPP